MSYIGQIRKTQINEYVHLIKQVSIDRYNSETYINQKIFKTDNTYFEKGKSYYIKFRIQKREDSDQIFQIKMAGNKTNAQEEQFIRDYIVLSGSFTQYETVEVIITPNDNYNYIYLDLYRTNLDKTIENNYGEKGRIMQIIDLQIGLINNILDKLNILNVNKIGIQGSPNLLMCINGEEFRIGKSGLYEINYDININFLGFICGDEHSELPNKYFIIDYQYEKGE